MRSDLLVLAAAAIWGVAFFFQKTAMDHVDALTFVAARGALACVTLLPFAWWEMRRLGGPNRAMLAGAAIGGTIFFLASWVQQLGIAQTTVINTGLLTVLYVAAAPCLFWWLRGERPGASIWAGVGFVSVGVLALSGGVPAAFGLGDALVAGAALFWALHLVVMGELGAHGRPLTLTMLQFLTVAVIATPLAVGLGSTSRPDLMLALPDLLYVGVLSSALTFALMATALQRIPASRGAVLLSSEVVFSSAAGVLLLGEWLTWLGWLGAALIVCGVIVVRSGAVPARSSRDRPEAPRDP